jgi:hypothetical protein
MQKPRKIQQTTLQNVGKGANMTLRELYDKTFSSLYIWNEKGVTEKDRVDSNNLYELQDKKIESVEPCIVQLDDDGKIKEMAYQGIAALKIKFE